MMLQGWQCPVSLPWSWAHQPWCCGTWECGVGGMWSPEEVGVVRNAWGLFVSSMQDTSQVVKSESS